MPETVKRERQVRKNRYVLTLYVDNVQCGRSQAEHVNRWTKLRFTVLSECVQFQLASCHGRSLYSERLTSL